MKKLILSASILFTVIAVNAQETEYNQIITSAKQGNVAQTTELLADFEAKDLNRDLAPEMQAEMYYTAGAAAENANDMVSAAQYYSRVKEIESKPYFYAKNKATKQNEYFSSKQEAEQVTSSGDYSRVKEKSTPKEYTVKFMEGLTATANESLAEANDSFSKENYEVSSKKYLETYYASKAIGNENDIFKYYAAISYLQTDDKQKAAELFEELIASNFTGIRTQYYATEKSSGKEFNFEDQKGRDLQVKLGLYSNPRTEVTESMEEELYSNATYAYYQLEDWENGIKTAKKGLAKFPNNKNMNELISSMYFNSGDSEEFAKNLEAKANNNTATAVDYFNLARVEKDNKEKAKVYYLKSIEMDPTFKDSYLNLALSIIEDEKDLVDLINNNLGGSAKEKKTYSESQKKRAALYNEALPYLEKAYELDNNDETVIVILKNTYEAVGNDDKFFEFKKLSEK